MATLGTVPLLPEPFYFLVTGWIIPVKNILRPPREALDAASQGGTTQSIGTVMPG